MKFLKVYIAILRRLREPVTHYKKMLTWTIANTIILSILGAYMGKLVSQFVGALEDKDLGQFHFFLIIFVCILVILYIINYVNKIISGYFQTIVSTYLDTKYMRAYLLMDNNAIETLGTGQANNIVKRGIGAWMGIINTLLSNGIGSIITIITALVLIGMNNPRQINLQVVILFFCFATLWIYAYGRIAIFRRVRRDIYTARDRLYVKIFMSKFEILQDHKINKEVARYNSYIPEINKSFVDSANTELKYIDTTRMIIDFVRFMIFFIGGSMVFYGEIDIATLILYIYLLGIVVSALGRVNGLTSLLTEQYIYVEKLRDLFDKTPHIKNYTKGTNYNYASGQIELQHMTFDYRKTDFTAIEKKKDKTKKKEKSKEEENTGNNKDHDTPKRHEKIFSDFSLSLTGGSKIALVGTSGCGKSTLAKLIGGYLYPTSGAISVDGQNLQDINLKSYYLHTGYLTQEPSIFDGSVRENLTYAVEDKVSEEKIKEAIKLSECEFLYDLPEGLETQVGERGIVLSGGQRQRLAIAKIIVKNPDIIILDEPTSALDSFSEHEISEMFYDLFADKTIVVVAHRLQTVMRCDDIIVLQNTGAHTTIAQRGTHSELLAKEGIYASMFALQSGQ